MSGMRIVGLGLLILAFSIGGCGSSSSGTGGKSTVTGTAAAGGPLTGVTVTLKNVTGGSRTATTASDGTFSIDTSGLTAPFLVQIVNGASTKLYSVSADANAQSTINVTPLTDLIIRSWYNVQGVSVDDAFAAPASNPAPTPTAVSVISNVVTNIVQLWMNQAGVTSTNFNLIATPFTADGTGVDHVLDLVTVDTSTGQVTITDGTTTQQSTVTYSTSNDSMSVSTTTTGPGGTSTSTSGTVVPVQTAQQTAVDAIATVCNNFADTINTKGNSLQASNLLPYLDSNALWGGLMPSQWAGQIAYALVGKTVSFSGITIKSLDTTGNVADTVFQLSQSQGGQTSTSPNEFFFRKVNGAWLLSGDQRIADIEVRASMVTNQGAVSDNPELTLEVNVDAPQGTVTGVTVSGGPWTSATSLTPGSTNVAPWDTTLTLNSFGTYDAGISGISGGTPFTFVVTPSSGPAVTYTLAVNATTTEAISITNLTGGTIADAHLGSPQTVNWTLPKTFAISQVRLGTVAWTGDQNSPSTLKCDDMGETTVLGTTSTTGQITIPATCGQAAAATLQAEIYLQVYGINGEFTTVYYTFQ